MYESSKTPLIAMSTVNDGSMLLAATAEEVAANRELFLSKNDIAASRAILVKLSYEGDNFCRFYTVSSLQAGDGISTASSIEADALFTQEKSLALFLPIADCITAVIYHPNTHTLGLSHLGRHNLEQHGGTATIKYMVKEFNLNPAELTVWLSPAAGRESYPLHSFNNSSLHEIAVHQLVAAGVFLEQIEIDSRDTTKDTVLYSHSQFLKGNRTTDGRQAVVAMMRP